MKKQNSGQRCWVAFPLRDEGGGSGVRLWSCLGFKSHAFGTRASYFTLLDPSFPIHDMAQLMTCLSGWWRQGLNENAYLEHGKCSERFALVQGWAKVDLQCFYGKRYTGYIITIALLTVLYTHGCKLTFAHSYICWTSGEMGLKTGFCCKSCISIQLPVCKEN